MTRADGWASELMGFGSVGKDKSLDFNFGAADLIDYETAAQMWIGDDMAARIIEKTPSEMLRAGWDVSINDDDGARERKEKLTELCKSLRVNDKFKKALCYEAAYGGSAILIGAIDGSEDLSQPLNLKRVRSVDWLTVLEQRDLAPLYYYGDPSKPKFREVQIYRLATLAPGATRDAIAVSPTVEIHESRLIIFPGIRVSEHQHTSNAGWGHSVLTRVNASLRSFNLSWAVIPILLTDFSQSVISVEGLADILAQAGGTGLVKTRLEAIELSRSVARAILIDSREKYERQTTSLAGMPETLKEIWNRIAAAADMPLMFLIGSAGGLNASNEGEIRTYYDRIAAKQEEKLTPQLQKLLTILWRVVGGAPEQWSIKYNSLYQPTRKEDAEAREIQARIDTAYIDAGVYSAEEVALSRFGSDEFCFETHIDFEARKMLDAPADEPADPADDAAEDTTEPADDEPAAAAEPTTEEEGPPQ